MKDLFKKKSSGHCERLGAGAVSRLCAQPLWCELYDMRDKKKIKQEELFALETRVARGLSSRDIAMFK